ncbi:MAG TPA: FecR domain-containing protein [Terriglobales bacterium]|jgi:hypothetical protein
MNKFRVAMTVLLFLTVAIGQSPEPVTIPLGSATVNEFKGDVSLRAPDGTIPAADRGMVLSPETTIETVKGSILLNLADGSQILVKPHSKVVLKAPDQSKGYWLEMLLGKIVATVQKRLGTSPSFKMGTPTAVITVRGTRFEVDVNKKQRTHVEVFEGLVQVEGFLPGAQAVLIRPGFWTRVNMNRGPDDPHSMRGDDGRSGGEHEGGFGSREGGDREGGDRTGSRSGTGSRDSGDHEGGSFSGSRDGRSSGGDSDRSGSQSKPPDSHDNDPH